MDLLRAVHRWVGLALAAAVAAVALSGGLLLLRDPYYRAVYPALAEPPGDGQRALRPAVLQAIERRWQAEGVRLVRFPRAGLNAYQVWLGDGTEAFVHPRSGEVIDRWRWHERLPAFLFELHAHLLVRPAGELVNGVLALLTAFLALSGLVLWWPARRGAFRLRAAWPREARPGPLLRSHAAVGAMAALPVLLFAATGAGIVFYAPLARTMSAAFDAAPPTQPDARVVPQDLPRRPWQDLLAAVDRTWPEGELTFYAAPSPANARLQFRKRLPGEWHPNGRSYVVLDPYDATVVQAIDARAHGAGTRLMYALYPLHAAKIGGVATALLAAATSVALTWLALGGAWTWLARRAARTQVARAGGLRPAPAPAETR